MHHYIESFMRNKRVWYYSASDETISISVFFSANAKTKLVIRFIDCNCVGWRKIVFNVILKTTSQYDDDKTKNKKRNAYVFYFNWLTANFEVQSINRHGIFAFSFFVSFSFSHFEIDHLRDHCWEHTPKVLSLMTQLIGIYAYAMSTLNCMAWDVYIANNQIQIKNTNEKNSGPTDCKRLNISVACYCSMCTYNIINGPLIYA